MHPTLPRRLALGGALALPFVRAGRAQQTFEFVAGSLGGGWYTMAAGVAALVRDDNPDIQIRVVPGGGLANPTRVNNNQSQMGWGIDAFTAAAALIRALPTKLSSVSTGSASDACGSAASPSAPPVG